MAKETQQKAAAAAALVQEVSAVVLAEPAAAEAVVPMSDAKGALSTYEEVLEVVASVVFPQRGDVIKDLSRGQNRL